MKLNNAESYEPIEVYLTPEKTPIAFRSKVECLKFSGVSGEQAGKLALEPIELELYYEVGLGLFAVEADAVESTTIYSPYTGIHLKDEDDSLDTDQMIKVSVPLGMSQIDIAYALKAEYEKIIRNSIIELVKQNNGSMDIPENNNRRFCLCMLDMGYNTFYFNDISYNGELLSFSGTNEENESLNIDELDLPDNGLSYLHEHLTGDAD